MKVYVVLMWDDDMRTFSTMEKATEFLDAQPECENFAIYEQEVE